MYFLSLKSATRLIVALTICTPSSNGFQPAPNGYLPRQGKQTRLASSVGGGPGGGGGVPPRGENNKGGLDDFLDPSKRESENLQKAREYMSENSLPITFDVTVDDTEASKDEKQNGASSALLFSSSAPGGSELLPGSLSPQAMAQNPYIAAVTRITPSDLIAKFTTTAHPRVLNAVRSTILGLIGGLPKSAFETTTVTTGHRLASLMFQLQMTGYMFKNAEYKLSMQQALGVDDDPNGKFRLKATDNDEGVDPLKGKIRGKLRVNYVPKSVEESTEVNKEKPAGIEVDAAAYLSELRSEVSSLRDELMTKRKAKEEALRKDLLAYIRTLPEQELKSLTNTMSEDVLLAMKGVVAAVIAGIGDGQIGPATVTEQSGEAMAQLCMWQLALGYNLRTLEVREEMKKSLAGKARDEPEYLGVDLSGPGVLE